MSESPVGDPVAILGRHVGAVARASSPTDVFRILLDAARDFVPRACVLLLREGAWRGWGGTGYEPDAGRKLKALLLPTGEGWLSRLPEDPELECVSRPAAEFSPDFGQAPASEAVAFPIRVGRRTVAALVAERAGAPEPWIPSALAVMAVSGSMRLELDLARRKLRAGTAASAGREEPARPSGEPAPPLPAIDPSSPPPVAESSLAPRLDEGAPEPGSLRRQEARRFARLVATDIRLYNEEAVMLGRRQGDLSRRLAEPMQRGRETFERRFADLGSDGILLLHDAYVQVLAGGEAGLIAYPEPRD